MGILQKVKWHGNERVDLPDLENVENFVCADFNQLFKRFTNATSLIVKGFRIFQDVALTNPLPTASPIYVELDGSVLIHSSKTTEPHWYVGASGTAPVSISLTANTTNYIEVDLTTSTGSPDNRAFWDPTANNNAGEEFIQSVDTVENVDPSITVNTTGFVGGNKAPIAAITVDSLGVITAFYDRRQLFFRLATGQPYNGDNQYSFTEGRYEAIHTLTLGSAPGSYLFTQSTASTTWTITHNLGKQFVSGTFYDADNNVVIPDTVVVTSTTTLTATFSIAMAGKCLIAIGNPSSEYYDHNEAAPSTTWTINHNLGTQFVNIKCYDASNSLVLPDVIAATSTTVTTVTFSVAIAGNAFVTIGGGDGLFAVVNQAAPATTWNIAHNLNTEYADITVYDSSNNVVIPDSITVIDQDNLTIILAIADSGNVAIGGGGGGDYITGETVTGDTSGTSAIVVAGGSTTITIDAKTAPTYTVGERLLGMTSGSSRPILTIKESFNTSDKSVTTLKEMLDAIMTEILRIKHGTSSVNKFWFKDTTLSLDDLPAQLAAASLKAHGLIHNNGIPTLGTDSNGISSLVYLSPGDVQVNWTTPFLTNDYPCIVSLEGQAGFISISSTNRTTDYVIVETKDISGADANIDFSIIAQGNQ